MPQSPVSDPHSWTPGRGARVAAAFLALGVLAFVMINPFGGRKPVKTSGAMKAFDFWTRARSHPARALPSTGYYDGYLEARALALRSSGGMAPLGAASHTSVSWQAIGPKNIGGRTLCVAFNPQNPNTIYAGSASGGLWRSTSAGVGVSAWEIVPTGYPVLGVSCIAIDEADSNSMYIGTGEVYAYQDAQGGVVVRTTRGSYGMGILKSTDGGSTWMPSLDWTRNQERGVWAVRIDPGDSQIVWAATTEGVYRSTDAGGSWTLVLNVIMATDLELHPTDPDTAWAACGNLSSAGFGIYKTTNAGQNWTKLAGGLPGGFGGKAQITLAPSDPDIIYASIGNGSFTGAGTWLARSINGGTTWSIQSTTDYATFQGWYSHDVAVDPNDPDHVFAVGVDIWESTAGGASLTRQSHWDSALIGGTPPIGGPEGPPSYSHADHHAAVYHPVDPGTVYFANDGGVFRTTDGGTTFEGLNGGLQTSQFYAGFSNSAQDTTPAMGGMQDNYTAIYEGTGAWRRIIGGDGSYTAIDPTNSATVYGSYQFLNILRSFDTGVNLATITPPAAGPTAFIAPFILSPLGPNQMYAGRGAVLRSSNQGGSWTAGAQLNGKPIITIGASASFSGTIFAATEPDGAGNLFYESINHGVSWTNRTGTLPNRYPMDMAVDRANDRIVYVVFSGYGTSHIYRTANGGLTWQDVGATLPDVPASAVFVDPDHPSHVYMGNDLGVFVSFDDGGTWGAFSHGLPEAVIVTDLTYVPSHRRIRVSTHGNGVYERPLPDTPTGVAETSPAPVSVRLRNAPNPFDASTTLHFALDRPAAVEIDVFDVGGRRVRSLLSRRSLPAGEHEAAWDGRDDSGRGVAAGTYFGRISAGRAVQTVRITRVR